MPPLTWLDGSTTSRTWQEMESRLDSRHYNVKSPAFGAKGDGSTNDTAAIQAALDAAALAGGGVVVVPAGVYMVSGIVIDSNVTLRGDGVAATTIRLIASTTGDVLRTKNFATLVGTSTSAAPNNFHLRDLTLDANEANGTTGWVAKIYAYAYTVDHVEFWNGQLGGVYSEWHDDGTGNFGNMEAYWNAFKIKDYCSSGDGLTTGVGYGMYWNGPHDTMLTNGIIATTKSFIRPTLFTAGGATKQPEDVGFSGVIGLYVKGGAYGGNETGLVMDQIHVWGRNHFGIYPNACSIYASNCISEGAFEVNYVLTLGSTWVGGAIYGNSGGSSDHEVGIQIGTLDFNTSRACVVGVFMNNFAGAAGYPINVLDSAGQNVIRIVGNLGGPNKWMTGSPFWYGDTYEMITNTVQAQTVVTMPKFVLFGDGFAVRTKFGPPSTINPGYGDFISAASGSLPTDGALIFDTLNERLNLLSAGAWYSAQLVPTISGGIKASAVDYTLLLGDAGQTIEGTKGTAQVVTVPTNASVAFPIGTRIEVVQMGAGQITLTPAGGVTIRTARTLTTRALYSVVRLYKRATDEWVASGDLT